MIAAAVLLALGAQGAKPDPEAPAEFKVKLETTKGDIVIKVAREWSPKGADRFHALVTSGAYNDIRFYRVVPKFIAQFGFSGDPKVTAKWRDAKITDDPVKKENVRGTVTFAKSGPDSRTMNVFINLRDNSQLDRDGFSPFGEVLEGMEIADQLHSGYGNGPQQAKIIEQGNAYLDKEFKDLDTLKKASIVK